MVHWLATSPLRPVNRAPGKVATASPSSFTDMLAAAARRDSVEFRCRGWPIRVVEVIRRAAALIGWQSRPRRRWERQVPDALCLHALQAQRKLRRDGDGGRRQFVGRFARRVACAHDCGLVINPNALRAQIEGNIRSASRTLFEEVA